MDAHFPGIGCLNKGLLFAFRARNWIPVKYRPHRHSPLLLLLVILLFGPITSDAVHLQVICIQFIVMTETDLELYAMNCNHQSPSLG